MSPLPERHHGGILYPRCATRGLPGVAPDSPTDGNVIETGQTASLCELVAQGLAFEEGHPVQCGPSLVSAEAVLAVASGSTTATVAIAAATLLRRLSCAVSKR
jgi:hypothetical protein